jgi:hypothetical protein
MHTPVLAPGEPDTSSGTRGATHHLEEPHISSNTRGATHLFWYKGCHRPVLAPEEPHTSSGTRGDHTTLLSPGETTHHSRHQGEPHTRSGTRGSTHQFWYMGHHTPVLAPVEPMTSSGTREATHQSRGATHQVCHQGSHTPVLAPGESHTSSGTGGATHTSTHHQSYHTVHRSQTGTKGATILLEPKGPNTKNA